jgi:CDP-diglyceride synthetase
MGTRFLYGFLMVFALVGVLAIDHYANESFGLFFLTAVVMCAGVFELDRLLKFRGMPFDRGLLILLNLCTLAYVQFVAEPPSLGALAQLATSSPHYWFEVLPQYRQLTLMLPPLALLVCCFQGLRSRDVAQLSARILINTGSYVYLIFTVAMILWLRRIPGNGAWLLYFLLATSRMGDVGAYLMGRAVGRHKLIPHLSPGKTIEGALSGLAFSAAAGAGILAWAHDSGALMQVFPQWWYGAILGAFMGVAAQCGDLVKSALKRAAGVKDSGQLVPAFGGVLDIIDNFMLTGPLLIILLSLWPA